MATAAQLDWLCPQSRRFRRIQNAARIDRDAIMCARGGNRHLPIPDIARNRLRISRQRIAMATAAGLMMREQIAAVHGGCDFAGNCALRFAFAEPIRGASAWLSAAEPIGRKAQAIGAQLQNGFIGQ